MKRPCLSILIVALTSLFFTNAEVLAQENAYRYELGGQFSSLSANQPTSQSTPFRGEVTETERGVGGRFTFNVTNNIAFEAELNFFPKEKVGFGIPLGRVLQGQFGIKVGKRFEKVGVFAKVRPGFVRYGQVSRFTGSHTIVFINLYGAQVTQEIPEFGFDEETYSSVDVGGVMEFYPSRRVVLRFDLGDTIIRYSVLRQPSQDVCVLSAPYCPQTIYERPPETRHNLQFTAGVGIRF